MSQSERLRMRPAPPKCLAISSHVSFGGRAGLRASMPAYVALGVDASEVGTCHLSNHTGYRLFPGRVAAPGEIRSLAAGAQANGLLRAGPDGRQAAFRVVCTGYMASVPQSREIAELVAAARAGPGPGPLYVMDPVLGDDGELYVPSVLLPRALRMVLLSPQMSRRLLCLSEPDQLLLLGTGEAGTKRGLSRGGQAPADGGALPGGPTLTYFPQTRVDVLTPNQFELEQLAYPPEAGHAQAPAAVAGLEGLCAALWRVHRAYQVPAIVCTSTSYLGCRHRDPAAASACTSSFRHAGASAGGPAGAGPGAPPAEAFCCEDSCVDLRAFVPPGGRPADERFVAMEVVASFIPRERLAQLASVLPADVVDDGPDAPEPGIVAAADVAAELFRPVRFAVVRRTKYVSGTGDLFAAMVSARLAHALHAGGAFSEESFLDAVEHALAGTQAVLAATLGPAQPLSGEECFRDEAEDPDSIPELDVVSDTSLMARPPGLAEHFSCLPSGQARERVCAALAGRAVAAAEAGVSGAAWGGFASEARRGARSVFIDDLLV